MYNSLVLCRIFPEIFIKMKLSRTVKKIQFSFKDFFSKCDSADLIGFTEEILKGTTILNLSSCNPYLA